MQGSHSRGSHDQMMRIASRSTAIGAYRVFFFNLGSFFRLSGGWMACLLGCILIRTVPWPEPIALALLLVTLICAAVFSAAFSVGWCRALLDEEPASDVVPLTLGRRELRFLGYEAAMALVPGVPLLMLFMLAHADGWWRDALGFVHGGPPALMPMLRLIAGLAVSLPAAIAAMIILPRLMIALPAVATDAAGPLLGSLWQQSRGMTKPVLYGWLACVLPALGIWSVLWFELSDALGGLAPPLVELLFYVCWFVARALGGGFLCQVFVDLAERRPNIADASPLVLRAAAE